VPPPPPVAELPPPPPAPPPWPPQKPSWHEQPVEQSLSPLQGRVQSPLMQKSMPQSALLLQSLAVGGVMRQLPCTQNSPVWQSASVPQTPLQKPFTHAVPLQSSLVVH
jgi:hypothetical protein